jgi:hypothetical protein
MAEFVGENIMITLPSEPVLDGVVEEDRANVRNVIYMLHARKMCQSWSVKPENQGYEVVGLVDTKSNFQIEMRDMELIKRVDPLRVNQLTLRGLGGQNATLSVVIFILRKSEPIVLEEQEIVRIERKRKFWRGS